MCIRDSFIPTEEHVYSGQKAPVTLGHEFSGEIVEVGSDVTRVKVGDRVAVEPILAKNNLVGNYNLDPNLNFVGLAADGGFAKYCVLDLSLIHIYATFKFTRYDTDKGNTVTVTRVHVGLDFKDKS